MGKLKLTKLNWVEELNEQEMKEIKGGQIAGPTGTNPGGGMPGSCAISAGYCGGTCWRNKDNRLGNCSPTGTGTYNIIDEYGVQSTTHYYTGCECGN